MAIGFDFGTANSSVAHVVDNRVCPINLVGQDNYIPSTLCAPTAETVSEFLFRCLDISPYDEIGQVVLRRAMNKNQQEGIDVIPEDVRFGYQALDLYLQDPKDVYYIKSPKSFLGTMGLRDIQLSFFEDLVCAMMANIKKCAEQTLQEHLTEAVIGRPVNFLGRGGETSNRQAEGILRRAASRAGFKHIEFQFEPVAAGLEYESTLTSDKNVLVVDIGGGTTDCSMLRMGPTWCGNPDRAETLLGHTGELVGGNDLDTFIAFRRFMSEFGMGTRKHSGYEIPITQFWNPIMVTDVQAQRSFYSRENYEVLKTLQTQAMYPDKLARLLKVHEGTLGYSIVREAEKAKIALGKNFGHTAVIDILDEVVRVPLTRSEMEQAILVPKEKIQKLVQEALVQSGMKPDVIFMTGGSARSTVLRQAVEAVLPSVPVVSGNYFGSVTAGLARWADICFK